MFSFVFSIKLVASFQVPTSNIFFFGAKVLLKCEIGFGASTTPTNAFFLFFSFFFPFLGPKKQGFWIGFARFKRPALESCQIATRL